MMLEIISEINERDYLFGKRSYGNRSWNRSEIEWHGNKTQSLLGMKAEDRERKTKKSWE